MITDGITSADVRAAIERILQALRDGKAQLNSLQSELDAIVGEDPRREIYTNGINQMKELIRGLEHKMLDNERILGEIEREERRAA